MAKTSLYEQVQGFLEKDDWQCRRVGERTLEVRVRSGHTGHIIDIYCDPEDRFVRLYIDSYAQVPVEARGVVALELLRWNDDELMTRYCMAEGVVDVDVVIPVSGALKAKTFFYVLRQLYLSADWHFPKLMKLIWGDWQEDQERAGFGGPAGEAGTGAGAGEDASDDIPF